MEMDAAALTGFAAPLLKGIAKLSSPFFFFSQKVGGGIWGSFVVKRRATTYF